MKRILMLLFTLGTALFTHAQVTINAELKGLINQSFTYFPQIKEVQNTVTSAEERLSLTELNRMPEITADVSYAYIRPKIQIPINGENFQFAPINNIGGSFNATYPLFDFGRLQASVQRSKNDLQLAKHNVDLVKSQLAFEVANIYYNIVYFKKAIAIQDSVLSFLQDTRKIVESQLKNGTALKIDLLNIQAAIDNEENKKVDLTNNLQKQVNLLGYTTGSKLSKGEGFDFDISLLDAGTALGIARENNPDFALAIDKIKQSESDLAIVKLAEKPMVGLRAAAGIKNGYVPYIQDLRFNYLAGVSFTVPIYNGGRLKQQQKLQENLIKQNQIAVESLNNNYQKDIAQVLEDISSNLERIRNTRGQLEQANAGKELALTKFKNGTGTHLEITNASTNVQRAALTRLQYTYQLCLAKLTLTKLTGYQYWTSN